MPQFRYRAVTQAGEVIVGEIEATSREEVVRRIEYIGHLPIEAEAAGKGGTEVGQAGKFGGGGHWRPSLAKVRDR